jgi:hypothetical protein
MIPNNLIQASPALYAALNRIVQFWESGVHMTEPGAEEIMKTLIAKAHEALESVDG